MKKRVWISFKELREKLNFEDVLRHYKVEVSRKGSQHQGVCPLPGHRGSRVSRTFSANLDLGIFQCFGCGAKGNVFEFAALMERVDLQDGNGLRSVAVQLQQHFFPEGASRRTKDAAPSAKPAPQSTPVVVNHPLSFELKDLDAAHPYLANRGFTRETMRHFGVGFCSRGVLKDRVAIPLEDHDGRLVGYAGRVVDDATVSESNPRYRLPTRREHAGTIYEFRVSLFLYNGFRVKAPCDDLIVVSGFPSVWWLTQHGHPRSVALMGSDCSEEQAEAVISLVKPSGRVWLVPNGDADGEYLAQAFLSQVSLYRFVRWVKLGDGRKPSDLPPATLKEYFTL